MTIEGPGHTPARTPKLTAPRPRLGVYKLASCDGCQLTLLSCEDELLALAEAVDIVYFPEATSRPDDGEPLDLVLVEGSVSTPAQLEEIRHIRKRARTLITIGACATAGGIQALRNFQRTGDLVRLVYARPDFVDTLDHATPIADHVPVDFELRGCPIDKYQLLELITATLVGRRPGIPNESVCMQCKREGHVCVMVTRGEACLGPVTQAGCGALCPRFARGCYGCFGPRERANAPSLGNHLLAEGESPESVQRRFRGFTGWAKEFREESERHGRD